MIIKKYGFNPKKSNLELALYFVKQIAEQKGTIMHETGPGLLGKSTCTYMYAYAYFSKWTC